MEMVKNFDKLLKGISYKNEKKGTPLKIFYQNYIMASFSRPFKIQKYSFEQN